MRGRKWGFEDIKLEGIWKLATGFKVGQVGRDI